MGLITKSPKPDGRGSRYLPTPAGHAAAGVLAAIASWAEQWVPIRPEHSDPGHVLSSWCRTSVRRDRLPTRRVVVGFEFDQRGARTRAWMLVQHGGAEVCAFDPGFGKDLHVAINDAVAFTRWHVGQVPWSHLLKSNAVTLTGPSTLDRALPTWHTAPGHATRRH